MSENASVASSAGASSATYGQLRRVDRTLDALLGFLICIAITEAPLVWIAVAVTAWADWQVWTAARHVRRGGDL